MCMFFGMHGIGGIYNIFVFFFFIFFFSFFFFIFRLFSEGLNSNFFKKSVRYKQNQMKILNKCPRCGYINTKNSKFCLICGNKIN